MVCRQTVLDDRNRVFQMVYHRDVEDDHRIYYPMVCRQNVLDDRNRVFQMVYHRDAADDHRIFYPMVCRRSVLDDRNRVFQKAYHHDALDDQKKIFRNCRCLYEESFLRVFSEQDGLNPILHYRHVYHFLWKTFLQVFQKMILGWNFQMAFHRAELVSPFLRVSCLELVEQMHQHHNPLWELW